MCRMNLTVYLKTSQLRVTTLYDPVCVPFYNISFDLSTAVNEDPPDRPVKADTKPGIRSLRSLSPVGSQREVRSNRITCRPSNAANSSSPLLLRLQPHLFSSFSIEYQNMCTSKCEHHNIAISSYQYNLFTSHIY